MTGFVPEQSNITPHTVLAPVPFPPVLYVDKYLANPSEAKKSPCEPLL